MYFVYIIESIKYKKLYKGFTTNISDRLNKHNQGKTYSTKPYAPYRLIYYEAFLHKDDAIQREKIIKSKWGTKFLKRVLNNYFNKN